MSELIRIKKLKKFEFEIDGLNNTLGITEFGFAKIDIPIRQARVLSKWIQKELKKQEKEK